MLTLSAMIQQLFKSTILVTIFTLTVNEVHSQVISVDPVFPKESDSVTIIYDASLGNAALKGGSQVYAHAGVITKGNMWLEHGELPTLRLK